MYKRYDTCAGPSYNTMLPPMRMLSSGCSEWKRPCSAVCTMVLGLAQSEHTKRTEPFDKTLAQGSVQQQSCGAADIPVTGHKYRTSLEVYRLTAHG